MLIVQTLNKSEHSIIITLIVGLFHYCTISTTLQPAFLFNHCCSTRIYALLLQAVPHKYLLTPGWGEEIAIINFSFTY